VLLLLVTCLLALPALVIPAIIVLLGPGLLLAVHLSHLLHLPGFSLFPGRLVGLLVRMNVVGLLLGLLLEPTPSSCHLLWLLVMLLLSLLQLMLRKLLLRLLLRKLLLRLLLLRLLLRRLLSKLLLLYLLLTLTLLLLKLLLVMCKNSCVLLQQLLGHCIVRQRLVHRRGWETLVGFPGALHHDDRRVHHRGF